MHNLLETVRHCTCFHCIFNIVIFGFFYWLRVPTVMENLNQNSISLLGPPIKICSMLCFQLTILSKVTCESGIPWHLDFGAKWHSSCIHTLIKPFAKTFPQVFLQNSQQAHLHRVSTHTNWSRASVDGWRERNQERGWGVSPLKLLRAEPEKETRP